MEEPERLVSDQASSGGVTEYCLIARAGGNLNPYNTGLPGNYDLYSDIVYLYYKLELEYRLDYNNCHSRL